MACIRNPLRIWASLFLLFAAVYLASADYAEARFAVKLSPTLGELYTDNLFYTKDKEHDFVTTITPPSTLRFLGNNIPIAGGGYLRLFPYKLTA